MRVDLSWVKEKLFRYRDTKRCVVVLAADVLGVRKRFSRCKRVSFPLHQDMPAPMEVCKGRAQPTLLLLRESIILTADELFINSSMDIKKLSISILVPNAVGLLGYLVTAPALTTWYTQIAKPSFTPPTWVFAPMWVLLFTLMGISLYLVWQKGTSAPGVRRALTFFDAQLILNGLWPFLFFGLQSPCLAFIDIVALWIFIVVTAGAFWEIKKSASLLLLPYLAWVTYAVAMNAAIWGLN